MACLIRSHNSQRVSKLQTGKKQAERTEQHRTYLHSSYLLFKTVLKPPRGSHLSQAAEKLTNTKERFFFPPKWPVIEEAELSEGLSV